MPWFWRKRLLCGWHRRRCWRRLRRCWRRRRKRGGCWRRLRDRRNLGPVGGRPLRAPVCRSEVHGGGENEAKLGRWPVCGARNGTTAVHFQEAIREPPAATAAIHSNHSCLAVLGLARPGLRVGVHSPLALDALPRGDVLAVPRHTEAAARQAAGAIWCFLGRHRPRKPRAGAPPPRAPARWAFGKWRRGRRRRKHARGRGVGKGRCVRKTTHPTSESMHANTGTCRRRREGVRAGACMRHVRRCMR